MAHEISLDFIDKAFRTRTRDLIHVSNHTEKLTQFKYNLILSLTCSFRFLGTLKMNGKIIA